MPIISMMAAQEVKKKKKQKSLNPRAPEYFPSAKQNPNPNPNSNPCCVNDYYYYYFQNCYLPIPYPYLETYRAPIFPRYSTSITDHQQVVVQQQPHVAMAEPFTEPPARGGGGCRRNRRRSNQLQYRRPKFNHGDDFFHSFRNLQQQKHPILPVRNYGNDTTVMIRNIPNRFTREMLMDFLDDHCMEENQKAELNKEAFVSAFDFLYLPIDFKNRMNKGYAFVNFTDPRAVWKFYIAAHNKRWNVFQSNKIREIAYARVQGKEELVKRLQSVAFPCDNGKDEYLPVCFTPARDGSRKNVNQRTVGKCTSTS